MSLYQFAGVLIPLRSETDLNPAIASNLFKDRLYMLMMGASQPLLIATAVIITKQVLDGSDLHVASIHAASMTGLLLSIIYVKLFAKHTLKNIYINPHLIGWCCIAFAPLGLATGFTLMVFLAGLTLHISAPCQAGIYRKIYPDKSRGKWVSRSKQWQMFSGMAIALFSAQLLELDTQSYRFVFPVIGFLGLLAALNFKRIHIEQLLDAKRSFKFSNYWHIVRQDKNFRRFMIFQFMLGVSNIGGVAVLSVYLNDARFLLVSPLEATWILGILPSLAMFITIRWWGKIFDRFNIVHFRAISSCTIGIGFLLYPWFELWGATIGAIVWGIGRAGGQLAWTIGILPFVQNQQEQEYQTIHTFLTGVRGVMAPFIGIALLAMDITPKAIFITVGLLVILSAFFTVRFVELPR